jgi:hypothetical protein
MLEPLAARGRGRRSWPRPSAILPGPAVDPAAIGHDGRARPRYRGEWPMAFFDFAKVSSWKYRGRNSRPPEFWPEICPKNFF